MKVLVCGSRHYKNFTLVEDVLCSYTIKSIVHGAATGADSFADEYALVNGITRYPYPVTKEEWNRLGRSAGPLRNAKMLSEHTDIDLVIAFPGGSGTENMIRQAKAKGIYIIKIIELPRGCWREEKY